MDFSNINDILSSFSQEDIDSLKSVAEGFFGGEEEEKGTKSSSFFPEGIDLEMIGKITRILGVLNSTSQDPRCDLIRALKPLLSPDKRKRADEALKIMKLLDVLPMIQEFR